MYQGGGGKSQKRETKLTKVEIARFEEDWTKFWPESVCCGPSAYYGC